MARRELPPGWTTVLRAIVQSPEAWVSAQELGEQLGLLDVVGEPRRAILKRLAEMTAAGWLSILAGDRDVEHCYTLSPLAAKHLDCWLDQDPFEAEPKRDRWERRSRPGDWPHSSRRELSIDELSVNGPALDEQSDPFDIEDPQPGPVESVLRSEEAQAIAAAALAKGMPPDIDDVPWPTLISLGGPNVYRERSPEPGQPWVPPEACSCCGLRPLHPRWARPIGYCAKCGRWSWDEFFAEKPPRHR